MTVKELKETKEFCLFVYFFVLRLNRIPARFRQQLQNKGFTFAQFAGMDGDNIMDFKEMGKLIEDMLKEDKEGNN